MRVLLISSQVIPHVGGLSTHFQLLEQTLGHSGELTGVLTGGDIAYRLPQKLGLCVSRFAGADVARKRILDTSLERLSEKVQHMLQGRATPDLIHCHDPLASVSAHLALRRTGKPIPIIQTVHGPWSREAIMGGGRPGGAHISFVRGLEECAFSITAHLIAVDRGQAEILAADFKVRPEKITVVWNGIDTAAIDSLSAMPSPRPIREPYFVVPRRLVKKNGVDVALLAMARLQNSIRLAVAGEGPLRPELERAARALNLRHRVRFLGNLPPEALMPLIHRALGVIIPSIPANGVVEATSLAALESMACGTPILVSDIGGLHDIVSHAGVGFLLPPGDEAALASTMRDLGAMPDGDLATLRRRTRQAAAAFDVRHWFSAIHAVYDKAVTAADASALPVWGTSCR
jgi:glycosyltransferase involved in cell wall biosynthesis